MWRLLSRSFGVLEAPGRRDERAIGSLAGEHQRPRRTSFTAIYACACRPVSACLMTRTTTAPMTATNMLQMLKPSTPLAPTRLKRKGRQRVARVAALEARRERDPAEEVRRVDVEADRRPHDHREPVAQQLKRPDRPEEVPRSSLG